MQHHQNTLSLIRGTAKQILIVCPGALGDVIVTLPVIRALRDYFFNAKVEVMGYSHYLEIIKGPFYADKISRFDQADLISLFSENMEMSDSLKDRFEAIDFAISFVSERECNFSRRLENAGVRYVVQCEPFPFSVKGMHIVDYRLKPIERLGIPCTNRSPKIFLREEDVLFCKLFFEENNISCIKPIIAIHPGSGGKQKCWPVKKFAALLNAFSREWESYILIVSGPADTGIVKKLITEINGPFVLVNQLPLSKLAAILNQCSVYIGNDSGITHLAAGVGTPTIALFGPTDPDVWGPRGDNVRVLYKNVPCSPCSPETRKSCVAQQCLESIIVEDIIREMRLFLRF